MVSSVANGVISAATYTVGAVPVLLTGTAAGVGAAGNAVAGAVSQSESGESDEVPCDLAAHLESESGESDCESGESDEVPCDPAHPEPSKPYSKLRAFAKAVAKVTGGAATGTAVTSAVGTAGLNLLGFTAIGPAAGSYAAAWMSSAAIANGGAVAAGSAYSVVQATAMTGGILLGAPTVLAAGAVVGAGAGAVALLF